MSRPEQVVVGDSAQAHDRRVGLADQDRAGALHALRVRAVGIDDLVLEGSDPPEGRGPARLEVEQVLHRRWHAVQWAQGGAGGNGRLGCSSPLHGLVEVGEHEGVEAGVALLDAFDGRCHQLDW